MPITYTIDPGRRWLITVATGPLTYAEAAHHLEMERDDGGLPLSEFTDATRALVNFSQPEVRQIVELLRHLGQHNALGPTAVVVANDVSYGVVRMIGILVEDVCAVRPFRDRAKAEEWLIEQPPLDR
jgi:hypothetical protein